MYDGSPNNLNNGESDKSCVCWSAGLPLVASDVSEAELDGTGKGMHWSVRTRVLAGSVALATVLVTACKNDGAASCQGDGDCPTAYICRDNACLSTEQGANVVVTDSGSGVACANENAGCTVDTDCCAGTCTNNVCVSTAAQPTCTGASALCQTQDDCCTGLTCTKGVCQ